MDCQPDHARVQQVGGDWQASGPATHLPAYLAVLERLPVRVDPHAAMARVVLAGADTNTIAFLLSSDAGATVRVGATNPLHQPSGCLKILPGQNYRVIIAALQQIVAADANGLFASATPPGTNAAVAISPE